MKNKSIGIGPKTSYRTSST